MRVLFLLLFCIQGYSQAKPDSIVEYEHNNTLDKLTFGAQRVVSKVGYYQSPQYKAQVHDTTIITIHDTIWICPPVPKLKLDTSVRRSEYNYLTQSGDLYWDSGDTMELTAHYLPPKKMKNGKDVKEKRPKPKPNYYALQFGYDECVPVTVNGLLYYHSDKKADGNAIIISPGSYITCNPQNGVTTFMGYTFYPGNYKQHRFEGKVKKESGLKGVFLDLEGNLVPISNVYAMFIY